MNQLGFLPAGAKRAIVAESGRRRSARVAAGDRDGRVLRSGRRPGRSATMPHRASISIRIDFSAYRQPATAPARGRGAREPAVPIAAGIYARLPHRCAQLFLPEPRRHPDRGALRRRAAMGAAGRPRAGEGDLHFRPRRSRRCWPGCAYTLDVTGGWYDAGDQGKYVVNGGIALWTLLDLYEREQARGRPSPFADGRRALPEAGNGVDDLLDEARWEMEFMLAMQVPDGTA